MMVSGAWAFQLEHMGVLGEAGRGRGEADSGQLVLGALQAVALGGHQCWPHQVRTNQGVTSKDKYRVRVF